MCGPLLGRLGNYCESEFGNIFIKLNQYFLAKALMFSLAYMIHNPKLQADIKREISDVLAEKNDDFVLISHRPSLPLTEATVNEVLRIGNVGAVTPPRLLKVNRRETRL